MKQTAKCSLPSGVRIHCYDTSSHRRGISGCLRRETVNQEQMPQTGNTTSQNVHTLGIEIRMPLWKVLPSLVSQVLLSEHATSSNSTLLSLKCHVAIKSRAPKMIVLPFLNKRINDRQCHVGLLNDQVRQLIAFLRWLSWILVAFEFGCFHATCDGCSVGFSVAVNG